MRKHKLSGIYCLVNKSNNKYYIGQSVDIQRRLSQHFHNAKYQLEKNDLLYRDMQCFDFDIQILCISYNDLDNLERLFIQKFKNNNIALYNKDNGGNKNKSLSKETRLLISKNCNYKKVVENRRKKGYWFTDEQKEKLAKAIKDRCSVKVKCVENNKVFESIKDCADFYNTSSTLIMLCCKSKTHYSRKLNMHFEYLQ